MFKPRHYSCDWPEDEPMGVMQRDTSLTDVYWSREPSARTLPESILRLAHAEYERQYRGQDYERMQQRGGLSVLEVLRLLADYAERLGAKPPQPRT